MLADVDAEQFWVNVEAAWKKQDEVAMRVRTKRFRKAEKSFLARMRRDQENRMRRDNSTKKLVKKQKEQGWDNSLFSPLPPKLDVKVKGKRKLRRKKNDASSPTRSDNKDQHDTRVGRRRRAPSTVDPRRVRSTVDTRLRGPVADKLMRQKQLRARQRAAQNRRNNNSTPQNSHIDNTGRDRDSDRKKCRETDEEEDDYDDYDNRQDHPDTFNACRPKKDYGFRLDFRTPASSLNTNRGDKNSISASSRGLRSDRLQTGNEGGHITERVDVDDTNDDADEQAELAIPASTFMLKKLNLNNIKNKDRDRSSAPTVVSSTTESMVTHRDTQRTQRTQRHQKTQRTHRETSRSTARTSRSHKSKRPQSSYTRSSKYHHSHHHHGESSTSNVRRENSQLKNKVTELELENRRLRQRVGMYAELLKRHNINGNGDGTDTVACKKKKTADSQKSVKKKGNAKSEVEITGSNTKLLLTFKSPRFDDEGVDIFTKERFTSRTQAHNRYFVDPENAKVDEHMISSRAYDFGEEEESAKENAKVFANPQQASISKTVCASIPTTRANCVRVCPTSAGNQTKLWDVESTRKKPQPQRQLDNMKVDLSMMMNNIKLTPQHTSRALLVQNISTSSTDVENSTSISSGSSSNRSGMSQSDANSSMSSRRSGSSSSRTCKSATSNDDDNSSFDFDDSGYYFSSCEIAPAATGLGFSLALDSSKAASCSSKAATPKPPSLDIIVDHGFVREDDGKTDNVGGGSKGSALALSTGATNASHAKNIVKAGKVGGIDLSLLDLTDKMKRMKWNLDVNDKEKDLDASFEITKSGTFKRGGLQISRHGLTIDGHAVLTQKQSTASSISSSSPPSCEDEDDSENYYSDDFDDFDDDMNDDVAMIGFDGETHDNDSVIDNGVGLSLRKEDIVILETLGRGSSGVVYKCFHVPTLQVIAVKCISVIEQDKRRQLTKEISTLTQCNSPHIINFIGAYFDEGHIYLAIEYMNSGSLNDLMELVCGEGLAEDSLAFIAEQALHGLHSLHKERKVHRDIKPHNILLNAKGQVKISDFGILSDMHEETNQCQTFVGTIVYMSPERIAGQPYSYTSDIWSLGLSLLSLALGRYAIPHSNHYELITKIHEGGLIRQLQEGDFSPFAIDFFNRCLNPDPVARASAQELLAHPFLQQHRTQTSHSQDRKDDTDIILSIPFENQLQALLLRSGSRDAYSCGDDATERQLQLKDLLFQIRKVAALLLQRDLVLDSQRLATLGITLSKDSSKAEHNEECVRILAQQFEVSVSIVREAFECLHEEM